MTILDQARMPDGSILQIVSASDTFNRNMDSIDDRSKYQLLLSYPWLEYQKLLFPAGLKEYVDAKRLFDQWVERHHGVDINSKFTFSNKKKNIFKKSFFPKGKITCIGQPIQQSTENENPTEETVEKENKEDVSEGISFRNNKVIAYYTKTVKKSFPTKEEAKKWIDSIWQSMKESDIIKDKEINIQPSISFDENGAIAILNISTNDIEFKSFDSAYDWLEKTKNIIEQKEETLGEETENNEETEETEEAETEKPEVETEKPEVETEKSEETENNEEVEEEEIEKPKETETEEMPNSTNLPVENIKQPEKVKSSRYYSIRRNGNWRDKIYRGRRCLL